LPAQTASSPPPPTSGTPIRGSTVAEAIKALEDAGVLSWVNRIKRVREAAANLFDGRGWRWRVIRTSDAHNFRDPQVAVRAPSSF
jgi:hypothetical protein